MVRGAAAPVGSGRDGLRTLQVVDAVLEAARTGRQVDVARSRMPGGTGPASPEQQEAAGSERSERI